MSESKAEVDSNSRSTRVIPIAWDAALIALFFGAAAFLIGALYQFSYLGVFGMGTQFGTYDFYGTMFVTWKVVLSFVLTILLLYTAKTLREWIKDRPSASTPRGRAVMWLCELGLIAALFGCFAVYAYHAGLRDAETVLLNPTKVRVAVEEDMILPSQLYYAGAASGKYLFFSFSESGKKVDTFIVPQERVKILMFEGRMRASPSK